jgi:putative NIF3 family GTP cyclohydrolase 1 type 2
MIVLHTLNDIGRSLQTRLLTDRFPVAEQGGVFRASDRPVRRIGLALEPSPRLAEWVRTNQLDALWLHRPWRLDLATLPPDIGVLYHHLPFDERLTMGYNPTLAAALLLDSLEEFGYKEATDNAGNALPPRPVGFIGRALPRPFYDWKAMIREQFGGFDRAEAGRVLSPTCVAVAGAMTPALIEEAHARNVDLYITGAYRPSAQAAVEATGVAIVAIGHGRTEAWGLRALARLLRRQWPTLAVYSFSEPVSEKLR